MRERNIHEDLKNFPIFSCLSEKDIKSLEPFVYWRTYRKGQFLFMEGDPRERVYFLFDGFVRLERMNSSGSMLYHDYVKKYTMFPYGGLLVDKQYHYSAIAETDVELYYIPTGIFEDMIKSNRHQLIHVVHQLSSILKLHESRVQKITNPNAQDRVIQSINYLMTDLGQKEGDDVVIGCPITATELAKISGTSRETVSAVLKQLKNDHILSICSKIITIHNPKYFEEMSQ